MRVLFTETRRTQATPSETFEQGKVYDLSPASAERWKSRGVAVDAPKEERRAPRVETAPPAPPPAHDEKPAETPPVSAPVAPATHAPTHDVSAAREEHRSKGRRSR